MTLTPWTHENAFIAGTIVRADAMNVKLDGIAQAIQAICNQINQKIPNLPATFTGETQIPEKTLPNTLLLINSAGAMDLYPKAQFDTDVANAASAAVQAATSATNAQNSASQAQVHEQNAEEHAEAAFNSATAAATFAESAEQAKDDTMSALNTRLGTTGNLGTAAQRNVMTSPTDTTTPDAVMTRGAFGVGSNAPALNDAALNALRQSGFFRTTSTAFSPFSVLLHLAYSVDNPNFGLQLAAVMGVDFPQLKARVLNNGVWGGSVDLYTNRSAVGTVGFTSGVLNGAMFESGSGPGGKYKRFANRLQICTRFLNVPLTMTPYVSGLYIGFIEVSFAAAFADSALFAVISGQDQNSVGWASASRASASSINLYYFSKSPSVSATDLMVTVIGEF